MKSSKRIGIAVVGLGRIAEHAVLPAFRHSKKTCLVSLVSGDERKAARLAQKFGAADYYSYDDYALCLNHPQVQAVFIATPNGTHADFAERAAAAGKHVLVEKPMATTVEDARRMIESCRNAGVRLMVAYRKYFDPASLALRKIAASGKLGRLVTMHSAFTIMVGKKAPAWHFDRRLAGGGSLMDLGVYCVNTARWIAGRDPVEATGYTWTTNPERYREVEESIAFRLTFPEGLVLEACSSFGAAQSHFLRLQGERGWAALDPAFAYDEERRLFGKIGGRWFEKVFKPIDEFALELDAFAASVRSGRDPEPSGVEGLRDLVIMQAIYRAARENRAVPINIPYALAG
ncbi:MAG TPA: Gfo/Idh/MocA family oxidoreductase [Terriglobia bacterium]|nr:Gfo/Idh/MocA family oxidoreductase [Terriglobia bacterium]